MAYDKPYQSEGIDGVTERGLGMFLKLVSDVSSIESMLQSNHTLDYHPFDYDYDEDDDEKILEKYIDKVIEINSENYPEEAGNKKVVQILLNSEKRSKLAKLQGVSQESLYSEIEHLHLPEVLALVARHHGHGELYVALRSSIAGVISTVNEKEFLKQQIAEKRAELEAAEAKLAAIEAAEVNDELGTGSESRSNKRLRS